MSFNGTANGVSPLCGLHHVWTYTDGGTGEIPSGLACDCGMMVAHYTNCGECGHRKFEVVKVKELQEDIYVR